MTEYENPEQLFQNWYAKGFEDGRKSVEVVHAHWIVLGDDFAGKPIYCSNCHEHFFLRRSASVERMREREKHCFNCGARMDLEV